MSTVRAEHAPPIPQGTARGELYTHTLAAWLTPAPQAEDVAVRATLCGRITHAFPHPPDAPATFLFDDGTSACRITVDSCAFELQAGDYVAIDCDRPTAASDTADAAARTMLHARDLRLLSRPAAGPEFLRPGNDWYRLQADGRDRLLRLRRRAQLVSATRDFFAAHDFLEVEAPLAVPSPGLELHLAAFAVQPSARYLITSPEYQCKRLLAGGLRRIFSLGKVFRAGEAGPHHNPEFTMLEWYRAYAGWQAVADDVAALFAHLAAAIHPQGQPHFSYRGRPIDLSLPWPQMTVAEAMQRHAGVTLRGDESRDELRAALARGGHLISDGAFARAAWDDLFFGVFLDHVEPRLAEAPPGQPLRPIILHDWPLPLCALAQPKPGNPAVVERFEAYVAGIELCNGFGELIDAAEQRRRLVRDADERARRGLPVYPQDERFLSALHDGMPPSAGVALGVDRLMMLLLDAPHIRDVLPFAWDEL